MGFWSRRATNPVGAPDLEEVRRAIPILTHNQHGIELRSLPSGTSYVMKATDLDMICSAVSTLSDNSVGVYYTLHPIPHTLSHPARVGDILSRRWLLIDVDPVRAADTSATDEEKEQARLVSDRIMDFLATEWGWDAPVVIDSGNGWHQLYRIDLAADKHSQAIVRAFLKALAGRFSTPEAHVDIAVHNASRIAKLPGTWARKGPNVEDRPHRMARLVHVPSPIVPIGHEQINEVTEALVGHDPLCEPKGPPTLPSSAFRGVATDGREQAYARRGLELECARLAMVSPVSHARNNTLNDCVFRVATLVGAGWLDRGEVESRFAAISRSIGLPDREAAATIRSAMEAGILSPRTLPAEKGATAEQSNPTSSIPASERIIVYASEITPRKVEWLWPSRLPLGKLTTFAGLGGLGKTFCLCDITARVTRGNPWPDSDDGECAPQGKVLFVSGEDDKDDTIVPRLIECGADLTKVVFLTPAIEDGFKLAHLETLDRAMRESGEDCRLVVIDPPTSYLGGVDDHKNSELRGLLGPLKSWAARWRAAVVFNTHVNKGGSGKIEACMRVMGSVAWVNAVRAAHMFTVDPDDKDRCLFIPMKMNLGKKCLGLAYRIQPLPNGEAKVEWLGTVDISADDAMNREPGKPRRVVASEWLIERFREKLVWTSDELMNAAHAENLSRNALFEGKQKLDLPKARKVTRENGDIAWEWWVPPDWPYLTPENATDPT